MPKFQLDFSNRYIDPNGAITKTQIQRIHIICKKAHIDDVLYRRILKNMFNVASSKELTVWQAEELIKTISGISIPVLIRK